jgi:hypothetical protein
MIVRRRSYALHLRPSRSKTKDDFMKNTVALPGIFALAFSTIALPSAALAGANTISSAAFGAPPSGEVPILFNDRHVYAKPDKLEAGRVLAALVKRGSILVPLRSLFEQTGATVAYDAAKQTVDVSKPGSDVTVTVGKHTVVINGETRPLDVAPEIYKGALVVPLRVISEGMGAYVEWVPEKRVVIVRYNPVVATAAPSPTPTLPPTPSPAPPPFTPAPTATPAPTPTPYHDEAFVAGDYAFSPKVYNEVAPGQTGRNSFNIKGGFEFPLLGPTWMLEGDYRHVEYIHPANGAGEACAAGSSGCNTVVGSDPNYEFGVCPAPDAGCVTVPGYATTSAYNGLTQAYVPGFYAKEDDLDAKFAIKVADPRVYVGVGGFFKKYNYLGYPTLSGVGAGLEKLPDVDKQFSLYGSAWYYPTVSGKYTYPTSVFLGDLSGSSVNLQYSVLKYEVGATVGLGKSPLYVDFGYAGEHFRGLSNAPADTQVTAPFAGFGLRL